MDGIWWDSQRRLPDWQITQSRHFLTKGQIKSWPITMADATLDACVNAKPRLDLHYSSVIAGTRFDELITIEIINDKLIKNGFPLLTAYQRTVTQADFFRLSEAIRTEAVKLLGPKADQPDP